MINSEFCSTVTKKVLEEVKRQLRRVLREEKKFLLNYLEFYKVKGFLNQVMIPDSHNGAEGYMVRSLYFDTLDDLCFREKIDGVSKRKKMRLRIYHPDDKIAYLEMKQKDGKYQMKRSLAISKSDALELIDGNYDVLLEYKKDFAMECYSVLKEGGYVPKTVVQYKRHAFIAKENNIRITLDGEVLATEANFNIFDPNLPLYPVFPKSVEILEVKFNGFLLEYIKNFMDNVDKSELSVSKYCLARKASLNYVY